MRIEAVTINTKIRLHISITALYMHFLYKEVLPPIYDCALYTPHFYTQYKDPDAETIRELHLNFQRIHLVKWRKMNNNRIFATKDLIEFYCHKIFCNSLPNQVGM